ncbi:MAG: hypothetical protein KFB94_04690 [Methylophilaceae bacterium]|nr:MAG: hypothetical protein KFB94_04690 [Methylophilaceae bacterium]
MKMIDDAQNMRFLGGIHERLKQWKLSLIDLNHIANGKITRRRKEMLKRSHTIEASWWVVQADN